MYIILFWNNYAMQFIFSTHGYQIPTRKLIEKKMNY
jgi:hypothetical protein